MKLTNLIPSALLAITLAVPTVYALQAPAPAPAAARTAKATPAATPAPSAQDISNATTKGMVWVNTSTHVYHKPGGPSYGTTKHGKFMTEADATKAGFRAAKEPMAKKAKAAPAAAAK